eukprot:3584618-Prymnesium_polylepis.1
MEAEATEWGCTPAAASRCPPPRASSVASPLPRLRGGGEAPQDECAGDRQRGFFLPAASSSRCCWMC